MDALEGSYIATSSEYVYTSDVIVPPPPSTGMMPSVEPIWSSVLNESQHSVPRATRPPIQELSDGSDYVEGSDNSIISLVEIDDYVELSGSEL